MDGALWPAVGWVQPAPDRPWTPGALLGAPPFQLITTLAAPSGQARRAGARSPPGRRASRTGVKKDSYLVDSASSHMLVSKIKPCMSKYKQLYGETANGSLNQLSFI